MSFIRSWSVIIHLSIIDVIYNPLLKSDVSDHSKTYSESFNLQAYYWVHCEEETGAYYQLSRLTYKLIIFFFFNLKLLILPKNTLFKKFPKMYYSFKKKEEIIRHTYICTKCNDNFKFTVSLKSYEE